MPRVSHYEKNSKTYIIPVIIAGSPWKKVQVKYVPDEMDFKYVYAAFEQYGKVKGIEWEKPNLDLLQTKREKLSVEMMVTKNIPSFITIMETRFAVTYSGQIKTCSRCDSDQHEARNCDGGRRSYSQALGSSPAVTLAIKTLEEIVKDAETIKKSRIQEHSSVDAGESECVDSGDESEWKPQKKRGRKGSKDKEKRENIEKDRMSIEKETKGQIESKNQGLRRQIKKLKPTLTKCRQRFIKKNVNQGQEIGEEETVISAGNGFSLEENRTQPKSQGKMKNQQLEEMINTNGPVTQNNLLMHF